MPWSGGGGVLQDKDRQVCGVFKAGNEGKLVFLDLSRAARGEFAGLRRLAAARSPAEGALARGAGTPKPTTMFVVEDVDVKVGEDGDATPPAEAFAPSPELPPQGVRGGVGVLLPGSSISQVRHGFAVERSRLFFRQEFSKKMTKVS